ncbi:MAG TPA: hypothetical protein VGQ36_16180 [Thermoanaerobaculia bacterium]|jgi:hypothetical protein|nr:hypothetical protein [Thermoanaerobaculia bacterium]
MKQLAPLVFVLALPLLAATPESPGEIPVAEAIVFKNGLAFLTRQGPLTFRDGQAIVAPAPEALLGTLWIAAGNRRIDVVHASKEAITVESVATSVTALLEANAGRMVTLLVDDREYTGKLLAVPASEPPPSSPDAVTVAHWSGAVPANAERLVLLEVDGRVRAFNRDDVKSVAFAAPPVLSAARPGTRAMLSIHAKGSDGAEAATIRYLRSGMSWIPEYSIELLDDERARVVMKATLINDGEDLRNARLRFAVGFPNFSFAGVPSPMTLKQTLQEFLASLGRDASGAPNRFDNVMTQQMANTATYIGDSAAVFPGPPTTGESAEDLFFYEKEGVTLAKGERSLYPILNEVVPMRHLYRWTIPDENEETRSYGAAPRKALEDQVWHSVSLTNSGTTPWTTAPALVVSNGKPLAQDTLAYTAPGAAAEVKLTIATDVAVEREEVEVERKPGDLRRFGYTWDAVIIEGTLTMRNFKREAITIEVTKNIEGQSILRAPEGKVTRRALQPKAVNPSERLEWQVLLPAGGTVTVRYRYKVWVRE